MKSSLPLISSLKVDTFPDQMYSSRFDLFRTKSNLEAPTRLIDQVMTPKIKNALREMILTNSPQNELIDSKKSLKKKRRLRSAKVHFQESDEETEKNLEVIFETTAIFDERTTP